MKRKGIAMLFNSIGYLLFLPIVLLVYFILPKKIRYLWLLAASYFFYGCWNATYALLMLASTAITYASGLA
ncbi:MAG: MBOAT family protein, partial [Oscillospiraceae bacterium]|nr:MBOAT family protein [Oscillospiraceae bacterium]